MSLPDNSYSGTVKEYVESLDLGYQRPICITALRLIAAQRRAYQDDGPALQALAKMEMEVADIFDGLKGPQTTREVYGQPPQ